MGVILLGLHFFFRHNSGSIDARRKRSIALSLRLVPPDTLAHCLRRRLMKLGFRLVQPNVLAYRRLMKLGFRLVQPNVLAYCLSALSLRNCDGGALLIVEDQRLVHDKHDASGALLTKWLHAVLT